MPDELFVHGNVLGERVGLGGLLLHLRLGLGLCRLDVLVATALTGLEQVQGDRVGHGRIRDGSITELDRDEAVSLQLMRREVAATRSDGARCDAFAALEVAGLETLGAVLDAWNEAALPPTTTR